MILFLARLIKYTVLFSLILPLQLVGAIALLLVLPFYKGLKLPFFLRWYDSYDLYSDRDDSVYRSVIDKGWWARYVWLAWRNPLNYFHYHHLGLHWNGHEVYLRHNPDEDNVGDSTNDHPGLRHIEVEQIDDLGNRHTYFEYYWIYVYPFNKKVCFRFRLGHKISDLDNPAGSISQWVYVISPWKKFSGKA